MIVTVLSYHSNDTGVRMVTWWWPGYLDLTMSNVIMMRASLNYCH